MATTLEQMRDWVLRMAELCKRLAVGVVEHQVTFMFWPAPEHVCQASSGEESPRVWPGPIIMEPSGSRGGDRQLLASGDISRINRNNIVYGQNGVILVSARDAESIRGAIDEARECSSIAGGLIEELRQKAEIWAQGAQTEGLSASQVLAPFESGDFSGLEEAAARAATDVLIWSLGFFGRPGDSWARDGMTRLLRGVTEPFSLLSEGDPRQAATNFWVDRLSFQAVGIEALASQWEDFWPEDDWLPFVFLVTQAYETKERLPEAIAVYAAARHRIMKRLLDGSAGSLSPDPRVIAAVLAELGSSETYLWLLMTQRTYDTDREAAAEMLQCAAKVAAWTEHLELSAWPEEVPSIAEFDQVVWGMLQVRWSRDDEKKGILSCRALEAELQARIGESWAVLPPGVRHCLLLAALAQEFVPDKGAGSPIAALYWRAIDLAVSHFLWRPFLDKQGMGAPSPAAWTELCWYRVVGGGGTGRALFEAWLSQHSGADLGDEILGALQSPLLGRLRQERNRDEHGLVIRRRGEDAQKLWRLLEELWEGEGATWPGLPVFLDLITSGHRSRDIGPDPEAA